MLEQSLQIILIVYLLAVATAAAFGQQRALLAAPVRSSYMIIRLILLGLTFGKLSARPLAQRGRRQARNIKFTYRDWRERQQEEDPGLQAQQVTWAKGNENPMTSSAVPAFSQKTEPPIDSVPSEDEDPPNLYLS